MNVVEAIRARKSIRGFLSDPVPKEVLWKVLEVATRAPSGVNAQPWEITVVTGQPLEDIKRANMERMAEDLAKDGGGAKHGGLQGVYRRRQIEVAARLFELMGIARDDREKRTEWLRLGLRFFDAPAAIILSADEALDECRVRFDLGVLAQTICLAALPFLLGTCIQAQGVTYPEVLRRFAGIPEDKRIVTSIAIGYPDPSFPANRLQTTREPLENVTAWAGFDDG